MNRIKPIAMYLPQFHRVPENDEWWGKGFTEWTTVRAAEKYFEAHQQPRIPLNNNYYNLLEKETLIWQASLAKEYGVYGFCFYHYYFENGQKILEKPAEYLLKWKDIDVNFCFCWANQTWARTWSNINEVNTWSEKFQPLERSGEAILLKQEYGDRIAWKEHFDYLLPFFKDHRYIKIDNKPVFLIHFPDDIECLGEMKALWNQLAVQEGFHGIYLIATNTKNNLDDSDAILLRMPDAFLFQDFSDRDTKGYCIDGLVHRNYDDVWYNALKCNVLNTDVDINKPIMYGGFVNFDGTPRHGKNGYLFDGVSPQKFEHYLYEIAVKNLISNNEFLFINAWNEWGEGNYLEPDEKYGYAFLQAVKRIVDKCSSPSFNKYVEWAKILTELKKNQNKERVDNHKLDYHIISDDSVGDSVECSKKVAVFANLYYEDDLVLYAGYLDNVPDYISLYIITSSNEIACTLTKMLSRDYEVIYKENRGRDISGLLVAARPYISRYDYVCFVHDKRGKVGDEEEDAEFWRDNLWSNVLGKRSYVNGILNYLDTNEDIGLLVPHAPILKRADVWLENGWSGDYEAALNVCRKIGLKVELDLAAYLVTYGTVFWCKVDAMKKLFDADWKYEDFPDEPLPDDGTISHAIERLLGYVALDAGYTTQIVMNASYAEFYIKQLLCEALRLKSCFQNGQISLETERQNFQNERLSWEAERNNYQNERLSWEAERNNYLNERLNWENLLLQNFKLAGMERLEMYNKRGLDIVEFCQKSNSLYLYGAGIRGTKALLFLRDHNIVPKGILVTDKKENERFLLNIPIIGVEDIGEEIETTAVIVCIAGDAKYDVINRLQNLGCSAILDFIL